MRLISADDSGAFGSTQQTAEVQVCDGCHRDCLAAMFVPPLGLRFCQRCYGVLAAVANIPPWPSNTP